MTSLKRCVLSKGLETKTFSPLRISFGRANCSTALLSQEKRCKSRHGNPKSGLASFQSLPCVQISHTCLENWTVLALKIVTVYPKTEYCILLNPFWGLTGHFYLKMFYSVTVNTLTGIRGWNNPLVLNSCSSGPSCSKGG